MLEQERPVEQQYKYCDDESPLITN